MSVLADYHTHSHHSGDSDESMDKMVDEAIKKGLKYLCFTEHMDIDYPDVDDPRMTKDTFILDARAYREEFLRLQKKYGGSISLNFGVELGLQPHIVDENRAFVKENDFDFVIASIHVSKRRDPYYPAFYDNRSEEEAFREVMEETLENIRLFDDFDVLGHLDYIVRYLPSGRQAIDTSASDDIIDEILMLLIKRGQGLDLNTKQLSKGYPDMNPSRDILTRYLRLGGSVVTFGSDAHSADNIAAEFIKAERIAKECGLEGYCTFSGREPAFHRF